MAKRANKALFGSMVFLTIFLMIVLSTSVYVFIQSLNRKMAINSTNSVYSEKTNENDSVLKPVKKLHQRINKLRGALSVIGRNNSDFTRNGKDYLKEFNAIEDGKSILLEVNRAISEYEKSVVLAANELDEELEKAEYPQVPMTFGDKYTTKTTNDGLNIHTIDLVNALGIPGSSGSLVYTTHSKEEIDTTRPFNIKEFRRDKGLEIESENDFDRNGKRYRSISLSDSNTGKTAWITACHPNDSEFLAFIKETRVANRLDYEINESVFPKLAIIISNALGIPGSQGLFIGNKEMSFQDPDRRLDFDSIMDYGNFLKSNNLRFADNDFFKGPTYDYTVHYASKDSEIFLQLKGKIDAIISAIYDGAWAYPFEHATRKDIEILKLLERNDVAILIVIQKQYQALDSSSDSENFDPPPNFDLIINDYKLIGTRDVFLSNETFFGFSNFFLGRAKVFEIFWEGRKAFYFKYLRISEDSTLNLVISFTTVQPISSLNPEIKGKQNEIVDTVREIMTKAKKDDTVDIVELWANYLETIPMNNSLASLGVIFTKEHMIDC